MRIAVLLAALMLLTAAPRAEGRMGYITAGPMFHWNFTGYRFSGFSFGLELAYWNFARKWNEGFFFAGATPDLKYPGYGLALGFDGDNKNIRLYAEPQLGWGLYGFSLGPVLELSRPGSGPRWGIQGSGWANLVGGVDVRYRYLDGRHTQALGVYAKLGAVVSGNEDPPEED